MDMYSGQDTTTLGFMDFGLYGILSRDWLYLYRIYVLKVIPYSVTLEKTILDATSIYKTRHRSEYLTIYITSSDKLLTSRLRISVSSSMTTG